MTIDEMKHRKQELGYSNKELSKLSGVPETTIQKLFSGVTESPRRETILKLESVLQPKEKADLSRYQAVLDEALRMPLKPAIMVKEASFAYDIPGKKQGEYDLSDYLSLPDEQRVEMIDGYFFDMAAPTTVHQAIGGFIYKLLLDHALAHGGPCMPFMSPVDVQLDEDDKTVVQPDVLIVCDRKKFQNGRVFGAPDFIVEVLSPSTRKKDISLKLTKYTAAGVREYWMIDPDQKKTVVYDLEHSDLPRVYGFQDKVPVLIWNSECVIDFAAIYNYISFLYD